MQLDQLVFTPIKKSRPAGGAEATKLLKRKASEESKHVTSNNISLVVNTNTAIIEDADISTSRSGILTFFNPSSTVHDIA